MYTYKCIYIYIYVYICIPLSVSLSFGLFGSVPYEQPSHRAHLAASCPEPGEVQVARCVALQRKFQVLKGLPMAP